jgi:hypothetical protein
MQDVPFYFLIIAPMIYFQNTVFNVENKIFLKKAVIEAMLLE